MDRVLVLIIGVGLGYAMIRYNAKFKDVVGRIDWVEQYLGAGGTYLFIKFLGLLFIVLAFLYAVGTLQDVFDAIFSKLLPGAA